MLGSLRIKVRPRPKSKVLSFEDILTILRLSENENARLRSYMMDEQRDRAEYHQGRYLKHLTNEELHLRIGYLIANAVFVSHRKRYSTNNLYANYWRIRLAHTAEELVIRGSAKAVDSDVLRHLPNLGFPTPSASLDENRPVTLYRYDKIKHLRSLRENGDVYLRCASTEDPTNDFARRDENEMCIRLRLIAEDLEMDADTTELSKREWLETINFKIYQRTDFFMFCLSRVFDWRLFGDFNADVKPSDPDDKIGCLVITDPQKFARLFAAAVDKFRKERSSQFSHELKLSGESAFYYDPHDPQECAPLFEQRDIMPFAKRREYTYQHEYRFVVRPNVPGEFVPTCAPTDLPQFTRDHLYLGSLEEISHIIEPDNVAAEKRRYYLSSKHPALLASAIGVTLPNIGDVVRFIYSSEVKETGRTDAANPMKPKRYSGSMGRSGRHIDVPVDRNPPHMLRAIRDFYGVFDIREHGNHLIQFEACDAAHSSKCAYRALLPCAEPEDAEIEASALQFEFRYTLQDGSGPLSDHIEVYDIDGHTYMARYNDVGPLYLHVTYRSLLIAEMKFIDSLIEREVGGVISCKVRNLETDYPCSEFKITN